MGYYENPPIIQPSRGGEIIGASIAQAGQSIAQGLIARGERRRAEEKEQKLTLQKLQDRKNETDLFYNEKMSKWSEKQSSINPEINKQIRDIVQQKVIDAADARIALLNETNATKRQEYLTTIRNADNILENAAKAGKSLGGVAATYRLKAKASTIGKPGGYVVNGKDDNEILDNTAFVESLSGMTNGNPLYESSSLSVSLDDEGDGFIITASGKHADGRAFNVPINTKSYIDAEENLDDGLLLPVESMDTFYTQSKETIIDKKGNIYDGFLERTRETVDLPSSGGDIYQIQNGQRLQEKNIRVEIDKKSQVTAAGILSADNPSKLKALLNYSLEQGPQYYDTVFKTKTPDEQKSILTSILTEKSFSGMVKSLERTTNKDGSVSYWNPTADIKMKEKPAKTGGGGNDTEEENKRLTELLNDPRTKQFNSLFSTVSVKGGDGKINRNASAYRQRQQDASVLNKIVGGKGQKLFMTRDELFEKWKKTSVTEGTEKKPVIITNAQRLKRDGKTVMNEFNRSYPGSSSIFVKEGGVYVEPAYDTKSRQGLVDLALSLSGEGGIKKFGAFSRAGASADEEIQNQTIASLKEGHPKRANETLEAYSQRIAKLYNQTK